MKHTFYLIALIMTFQSCSGQEGYKIDNPCPNGEAQNWLIGKQILTGQKETLVVNVSKMLETHLGKPGDHDFTALDEYDVIVETRIFSTGWIDLWEIVPKGDETAGYRNKRNPKWITKIEGTATKNLPPESVVNQVLSDLSSFEE
jgi:hypothetical protein